MSASPFQKLNRHRRVVSVIITMASVMGISRGGYSGLMNLDSPEKQTPLPIAERL